MRHMRPLDFKIGMTVMVAVLTAAILVLATTDRGKSSSGASKAQVRALDSRLSALDARVAAIQQAVARLAARRPGRSTNVPSRQLQSLAAQLRVTTRCMFQMQKEIDDLEGYLAYRTPLIRHRVTGACASMLQPRFGDH